MVLISALCFASALQESLALQKQYQEDLKQAQQEVADGKEKLAKFSQLAALFKSL